MKWTKIADQWYEHKHPAVHVGIRCFGRGSWGVYFRDPDGKPIWPTAVGGQEIGASSRQEAERVAKHYLTLKQQHPQHPVW